MMKSKKKATPSPQDIKIDYVDITEEEFNNRMATFTAELTAQFEESHRLEEEIMKQLKSLKFNV